MKNGKLLGGGESGKEVVAGAQSLMSMIDSSVRNAMNLASSKTDTAASISLDYGAMESCMKSAMADMQIEVSLVMDGRVLAKRLVKPMDAELAKIAKGR